MSSLGWALIQYGQCPYKNTQGEHRVKIKAEIGKMTLRVQGTPEVARTPPKPGERHGTDSSPQPAAGTKPADTPIPDL